MTTAQHRRRVLAKLMVLEDRVRARGDDDPNYVSDLLSIIDRVIKLLGLGQERHRIDVAVGVEQDPEKMVGYRKFVHENALDSRGSLRTSVGTVTQAITAADGREHSSDRAAGRQPALARGRRG